MYNRFKILSAKPLLGEKAIVIESNYEISNLSITPENIRITNPGDPVNELLWKDYLVKGKVITLFLTSEPLVNHPYIVRVQGLKNIIDEELETNYKQSIEFKSYISSHIKFIAPNMHSIVSRLEVRLQEDVFDQDKGPADYFTMQISSDPLFQSELLLEQNVYSDSITFDLDYKGQVFVRCRANYTINTETCFGDWITTTCLLSDSPSDYDDNNNQNNFIEIDINVIKTPAHNQTKDVIEYVFDTTNIINVDSIEVLAKPILEDESTSKTIEIDSAIALNKITLMPKTPLPKNHWITVTFKNLKAENGDLSYYAHSFCSLLEPCYSNLSDIKSILNADMELDAELVYYHLIEASKLVDYYIDIKLNNDIKNYRYYAQVDYAKDLEKNMFVKYYAAGQIFSQIRSSIIYDMSLSGKIGEIEISPKASLPDLNAFLKELSNEAEKWKLAVQGYKNHPAQTRSAIKSKTCLPHNHYRGGR